MNNNSNSNSSTTGKPLNITVENIKKLDGTGNLKAFVSVSINNKLTVHSCRIIQQPSQKAWVSLPQREWTDQAGAKHFAPLIEVSDKIREAIQETVLRAWEGQS